MSKSVFVTFLVLFCIVQSVLSDGLDPQIYGGTQASNGQFPFMIQLYNKAGQYFFCGGSLIGVFHILTAAHCTDGSTASQIQIWTGSIDHNSANGRFIDAAVIYQHPSYNGDTIKNDVSVIKLVSPFPRITGVRSIALASTTVANGITTTVAGWGKTETGYPSIMLYTTTPIISQSQCQAVYSDVDSSQICAHREGHDSCQGDSGGPLFTGSSISGVQHGIVSYGAGCGTNPGVYAKVAYYRSWIISQTTHVVAVTCTSCSLDTSFRTMCQSMGGVFNHYVNSHACSSLNADKTRTINYSWTGCTNTLLRSFCERVGIYSCVNGSGKCTRV